MEARKLFRLAAVAPVRGGAVPVGEGPRISALVLLILTLGLFGLFYTRRTELGDMPMIRVNDQPIVDGTVTVAQVRSPGVGWIVIYRSGNATVGEIIGFTPVPTGNSSNVIVPVNVSQATPTLFAILHRDLGTALLFEYPGPDEPVFVNGMVVMDAFQVTAISDGAIEVPPIGADPPPPFVQPTPLPPGTFPPIAIPSVTVFDQPLINETVTVQRVATLQQSWVTIHADENGQPGMILGAEPVPPGERLDIVIPINVDDMTVRLHAVLYADLGVQGAFEIPGADTPIFVDGQLVTDSFFITGGVPIILPPGGGTHP
jgi:hypothetical protein